MLGEGADSESPENYHRRGGLSPARFFQRPIRTLRKTNYLDQIGFSHTKINSELTSIGESYEKSSSECYLRSMICIRI